MDTFTIAYNTIYRYHKGINGRYRMSASNFNLRGIPSEVMVLLKKEAARLHTSVNALVLKMIERGLGFSLKNRFITIWTILLVHGLQQKRKPLKKIPNLSSKSIRSCGNETHFN